MKKIFMILVAALMTVTAVFAQGKPVVVVVPFDAKNVSKDDVDIISEVFLSEYTSTNKATVVDRSSFDKIQAQQKFELSDWSDSTKVSELGKALNAHQIITGQISQFGTSLVCTIKLLDVNSTEIIASATKRVANFDQLFDECSKLAKEMAAKATLNARTYGVGDKGPAGGIIYRVDGDWRCEISENLGEFTWSDANVIYQVNGTPYYDWILPSTDEMKEVRNNLVKNGLISTFDDGFWTDDKVFYLKDGKERFENGDKKFKVRLIRKFNINNTAPQQDPNFIPIGVYTTQISIEDALKKFKADATTKELRTAIDYLAIKISDRSKKLNLKFTVSDNGTYTISFDNLYAECSYNPKKFEKTFKLDKWGIKTVTFYGKWRKYRTSEGVECRFLFTNQDPDYAVIYMSFAYGYEYYSTGYGGFKHFNRCEIYPDRDTKSLTGSWTPVLIQQNSKWRDGKSIEIIKLDKEIQN